MNNIDHYAVMGNPIEHSQSPRIHSLFAEQTHQSLTYEAILVAVDGFTAALDKFRVEEGKGLNITVPFKRQAWQQAEQCSERAQLAGAVNTLIRTETGWFGDNTDGVGLLRDLTKNHQLNLTGKRLLILGAGGATRGVIANLLEQQPAELRVANRTVSKAIELAKLFADLGNVSGCGLEDIGIQAFDCIINATAASLQGQSIDLPAGCMNEQTCVYDMMYAAEPTPFMQWAEQQGVTQCYDGLGMLVEQAAESFYLWRDVRPQTQPVIDNIRQHLLSQMG
jgi:shikimate dehydrogenase